MLRDIGLGVFLVGYAPAVAAAAPSTLGLVARGFYFMGTFGLGCYYRSTGEDNTPPDDYWCRGDHGAVQMLVPVVGPFLFARNHPKDSVLNVRGTDLAPFARGALYASGGVQASGLVLAGIGALMHMKRAPPASEETTAAPHPVRVVFRPVLDPRTLGASLAGSW
jgi:hypothetical protein